MARRQPQPASAPLWPKILLLLVICLLVGGFFAYYPGVQRLIASLKHPATAAKPAPAVSLPPSAATPTATATPETTPTATASATPAATPTPAATAAPALASKERATYDREIKRLNKLVKAKNQQIDDLRIQIKLLTEGSRTAQ